MYESFFECRERPFPAAPLIDRYFPGRTIEAARLSIERCLERAEGTALAAGPAGTGKTLLLNKTVARFRETMDVAVLSGGALTTRRAFLQALLYELGLPYRGLEDGELRLALINRLSAGKHDRGLLLALDDAHLLPMRLLEEVRMLADLTYRGEPRVRTLLVGAPTLEERLGAPRLVALQQRITTRAYLEAFDRSDTYEYVRQQIVAAGGDPYRVFTDAAIDAIVRATDGIPRLINQTCDHALVLACAGGVKPVDAAGIEEAWADLQQLPTPWSQAKGYAAPTAAALPERSAPGIAAGDSSTIEYKIAPDKPAAIERPDVIEFVSAAGLPDAEAAANEYTAGTAERDARHALNVIETQLAEWESEFTPMAKSEPEVELRFDLGHGDPFCEEFVEEEVVVDRYAATDRMRTAPKVQVYAADAQLLSTLFETQRTLSEAPTLRVATPGEAAVENPAAVRPAPAAERPAAPSSADAPPPHARFNKHSDPVEPEDMVIVPKRPVNDSDMIVIEDEPVLENARPPEATLVRKKDYRQMFARLRRSS